jgi:hypothetical protein
MKSHNFIIFYFRTIYLFARTKIKRVDTIHANDHLLPQEVRLKIFGYLAHADWTRLASHNRRTGKVLTGNAKLGAIASTIRASYCIFCVY